MEDKSQGRRPAVSSSQRSFPLSLFSSEGEEEEEEEEEEEKQHQRHLSFRLEEEEEEWEAVFVSDMSVV